MLNELLTTIVNFIQEYFMYIGLAIMLGVNKAVEKVECEGLPFTLSNILKYSIVFSITAPLKLGSDLTSQAKRQQKKLNIAKKEEKVEDQLAHDEKYGIHDENYGKTNKFVDKS